MQYGLTSGYELGQVIDSSRVTAHLLQVPGLQSGTLYHYRILSSDSSGNIGASGDRTVTTLLPAVTAPLRLFLQGPYDVQGDSMKTNLRSLALLPLAQPFGVPPWNYTQGSEVVDSMPAHVVDWVLVDLRGAADSTLTIARRAALLLRSGAVVDTDGVGPVTFVGIGSGNYWVIVRHRNHLSVMTASTIPLSAASPQYDFTASQGTAFGIAPMQELEAAVFGLRSGDGNADGGIDALDRNLVWRPQNGTSWTYQKYGDFNLDGGIDALDLNLQWRPNNGTASQVPEPTLMQSAKRAR